MIIIFISIPQPTDDQIQPPDSQAEDDQKADGDIEVHGLNSADLFSGLWPLFVLQ